MELLLPIKGNPVPADYYDTKELRGHVNAIRARIEAWIEAPELYSRFHGE